MKLKAAFDIPILITSFMAIALIALGVGFAPNGDKSKLVYNGNLWCVSNYIEKEPQELLKDGQPRQDPLLDTKEGWVRREQVEAGSKDEAMQKVDQKHGALFARSEKNQMRGWLTAGDEQNFTHHYNEGATEPGPCWGSGDAENPSPGKWVNDIIQEECFGIKKSNADFAVVKPMQVTITSYSPNMPGNKCDAATGGGAATADSSGRFKVKDGRIRWVNNNGEAEDYVFAEPTTNNIIPWAERNRLAIVLPGFNNDQPIHVRDHYASGLHANQNYLDLFAPCDEYNHLPTGSQNIMIVDTTKPIAQKPASDSPKKENCPTEAPAAGPSSGQDLTAEIARILEDQPGESGSESGASGADTTGGLEGVAGTKIAGKVEGLGDTANPGGDGQSISFNDCHGRTLCHRGYKSHHNSINGYSNGDGDAVDISNSSHIAYAAFSGTVKEHYGGERSDLVGIRLTSEGGAVVADYYHVVPKKTGQVKAGEPIGRFYPLNHPHIHFELAVQGKIVHGTNGSGSEREYVESLWQNMKTALGL